VCRTRNQQVKPPALDFASALTGGGVRAGVLWSAVDGVGAVVGGAGCVVVVAGDGWAGGFDGFGASGVGVVVGSAVEAGGATRTVSGVGGDGGAGAGAGSVSGWAAAVWVSVDGRWGASEWGAGRVGQAIVAVGAGSGVCTVGVVDVRAAVGGVECGGDCAGVERAGCAVSVGGGSGSESASGGGAVGGVDPGESAVHGVAGVESAGPPLPDRWWG